MMAGDYKIYQDRWGANYIYIKKLCLKSVKREKNQ